MRIGLLSDLHLGYTRGHKALSNGCNIRENDVYLAARAGVENLLNANVDAILDLGDIANVPNPKKRALIELINLINSTGLDWYSVNGNHTLQRTQSDAHLYEFLKQQCPRFVGVYAGPTLIPALGGYLIPYDAAIRVQEALVTIPHDIQFVAGHWACDDANWPGEHINRDLLPDLIPTFLGHWHTRSLRDHQEYILSEYLRTPIYIGSTERFAWGEAKNPTGVSIYDTDNRVLTFIDHTARSWVDIWVNPEDYLENKHYEQIEDAIVRVHITASPEQYHTLDLVSLRKKLVSSLEFQVLRAGAIENHALTERSAASISIGEHWRISIEHAKMPRGIKRADVERVGLEALDA